MTTEPGKGDAFSRAELVDLDAQLAKREEEEAIAELRAIRALRRRLGVVPDACLHGDATR